MSGIAKFDKLMIPMEVLYEGFTMTVLKDIARRLMRVGKITRTARWQIARLSESGSSFEFIIKEVGRLTKKSEPVVRNMFWQSGIGMIKTVDRSKGYLSRAMKNLLVTEIAKTNRLLRNLTLTTASQGQTKFLNEADLVYMQVTRGTHDYISAIRNSVNRLANDGVKVVHFNSGKVDHADVAMRRAVLTGMSQSSSMVAWEYILENNIDLIEVSAHMGARDKGEGPANHASWQGKIYSRLGNKKYPDFQETTGYMTVTGLSGINCRHTFYPYYEDTPRNWTDEELESMKNTTVKYNDKELPVYSATQLQRKIERRIRANKREAEMLADLGLPNAEEYQKIRQWQAVMRDFINQTGLTRHPEREGGRVPLMKP